MTIVSKVSLAVALIIESAMPVFSHFEFAKIRFDFCPCKSFLVFVCKSTTVACNLFARRYFLCFYFQTPLADGLNLYPIAVFFYFCVLVVCEQQQVVASCLPSGEQEAPDFALSGLFG